MKAYILDMDGTLIDSMGLWVQNDKIFLAKRGIAIPDDYDAFVAKTIPLTPIESARHIIQHFNLNEKPKDVMEEYNAMALEAYSNTIPLKPGVIEFLQNLRKQNAKMAIATSAPMVLCMAVLQNNKIVDLFDAICASEEVGVGKSSPDIFLLAAKRLEETPKNCVVYDDSLIAIQTAKSIGMTTFGVYDEHNKNEWEQIKQVADFAITSFTL